MNDTPKRLPNLDAMSPEELVNYWAEYRFRSVPKATALLGPIERRTTYMMASAHYAMNMAVGHACQGKGDAEAARKYFNIADRILEEDIPGYLHWHASDPTLLEREEAQLSQ